MIDRNSPIPLYHQLGEILLTRIKNKTFLPGDALPTEEQLAQETGVSRITVRTALGELEKKGYIERRHGRGTFVAAPRFRRGARQMVNMTEEILSIGEEPVSRLLTFRTETAQSKVAELLKINQGQQITFVEQLRLAGQLALNVTQFYLNLPAGVVLSRDEVSENSPWDIFAQKGILIGEESLTIQAVEADAQQANLLQVSKGAPLLLFEGVTSSIDGVPLEITRVFTRTDRCRYSVHFTS
jgi:GntR family transcriptional regulator